MAFDHRLEYYSVHDHPRNGPLVLTSVLKLGLTRCLQELIHPPIHQGRKYTKCMRVSRGWGWLRVLWYFRIDYIYIGLADLGVSKFLNFDILKCFRKWLFLGAWRFLWMFPYAHARMSFKTRSNVGLQCCYNVVINVGTTLVYLDRCTSCKCVYIYN